MGVAYRSNVHRYIEDELMRSLIIQRFIHITIGKQKLIQKNNKNEKGLNTITS